MTVSGSHVPVAPSVTQLRPDSASREQVAERVRRYYRLVDDNDIAGLLELFAESAEYARPGYDVLSGRQEIHAFYSGTRVIAQGRHTLRRIVVEGREAAVHGNFHGTLRDGSEVSLRFADFFRLDDSGLFRRRDTFFFSPMV